MCSVLNLRTDGPFWVSCSPAEVSFHHAAVVFFGGDGDTHLNNVEHHDITVEVRDEAQAGVG